jgi:hypothetical protein
MANGLIDYDPRFSPSLRSRPQGQITAQGSLPVGYNIPSNLPQLKLPNSNMLRMPIQGIDARMTPMQDVGFQASQAQPSPPPEPQGFRQRARGILGSIGGFFQNNPNLLDTLAIGFGGMSMNPNQALMQQAAGRIQQRQELDRIQGFGNRTADALRAAGREDLAAAIEANPELAPAIYQEYLKSQFETPKETFRIMSAQEAADLGLSEGESYQVSNITGKVTTLGGGDTNISLATPTVGEMQSGQLANRLEFAQQQIQEVLQQDPTGLTPKVIPELFKNLGLDYLQRLTNPSSRQIIEAAQRDMLDAALTLGTGAAYTAEQIEGYRQSYFPQLGDDEETIQAKASRLEQLIQSSLARAGRGRLPIAGQGGEGEATILSVTPRQQ